MQSENEITTLYQEARIRWLKPPEVLLILQNHERLTLTHTVPQRPTSGSLFLFNKRVLKFFRQDGHQWRRKRDGSAIAEAHERLKVGNTQALNCYYTHGEHDPTFQRRIYWMLEPEYEHIVLVHYRDVSDREQVTTPRNDIHEPSQTAVNAVLNPTSPARFDNELEFREKLKEVELFLELRLPEHNIPVVESILVISCGDNQDSEETYFISCIFTELCLHGYTPFRYDIARSTMTANQEIMYPSRVGIMIFSKNYARSRQCLTEVVAIMDHFEANNLVLIPVYFKVSLSDIRNQSGSLGRALLQLENSVGASQFQKWRVAMIKITSTNGYLYMKG